MKTTQVFDPWPEKYDQWFETPMGRLIKTYETELVLDMLRPSRGERILDAGCGTGVFTQDLLLTGARVVGLELSLPMLARAREKLSGDPFTAVQGDMNTLPFKDHTFDKSMSITAIEFIQDARTAVDEFFRVTRPGGHHRGGDPEQPQPLGRAETAFGKRRASPFSGCGLQVPGEYAAPVCCAVHMSDGHPFSKRRRPAKGKGDRTGGPVTRARYRGLSGVLLAEASSPRACPVKRAFFDLLG